MVVLFQAYAWNPLRLDRVCGDLPARTRQPKLAENGISSRFPHRSGAIEKEISVSGEFRAMFVDHRCRLRRLEGACAWSVRVFHPGLCHTRSEADKRTTESIRMDRVENR